MTLPTAAADSIEFEPDWRTRLLAVITDPSIAICCSCRFLRPAVRVLQPGLSRRA